MRKIRNSLQESSLPPEPTTITIINPFSGVEGMIATNDNSNDNSKNAENAENTVLPRSFHILFISEYYPPAVMGGGEINLQLTAEALARKGCKISVITSHARGCPAEEEKNGIRIYRWLRTGSSPGNIMSNISRNFLFPSSIVRSVSRFLAEHTVQHTVDAIPVDAIHFIGASVSAAPALKKHNIPLIATVESFPALCPKGDRLYKGKEECRHVCSLPLFMGCQQFCSAIGKLQNRWFIRYNLPALSLIYSRYSRLRRALRDCKLVAISRYVQRLLQQHGLESALIPNAFELTPFFHLHDRKNVQKDAQKGNAQKDSTQKDRRDQKTKLVVLYVGAFISSKGPQVLLEALKELKQNEELRQTEERKHNSIPNIRCELYGDGILRKQLQQLIDEYALDAELFPPVPYEKMPQLYANADIVVFPSLWPEPFGRIPVEAMAAGKPIIASNIGAIPEIVRANTNVGIGADASADAEADTGKSTDQSTNTGNAGLLVPPGDAVALSKALLLFHNATKREEYGKAAQEAAQRYARQRYTQDSIAEKLLRLYRAPGMIQRPWKRGIEE